MLDVAFAFAAGETGSTDLGQQLAGMSPAAQSGQEPTFTAVRVAVQEADAQG